MSTKPRRIIVALKLPQDVPGLIKSGRAIVVAMTGNPFFSTPTPALAALSTSLDGLQTAETTAVTRAKGTIEARDTARLTVVSELHAVKAYVQEVADADRENAEKIITSAAMSIKKSPVRTKNDFSAKSGVVMGSVKLIARATARRASYEWQYSTDGGKTWVMAPSTLQSKTTVSGLPVGVSCEFRFRPVLKAGEGDWSQVIAFVVT